MNLIRLAIERPVAVVAAVLMVVMFGIVALQNIPIQLTPDTEKPVISVSTTWPGASPVEMEREVVTRQEEVLRGIEGLEEIRSTANDNSSRVTLEFAIGQDLDKALLLVANRLDRVSDYPEDVDEPRLDTAGSDDQPIAWLILSRRAGNERPIQTYRDFAFDVIGDRLERVPGVSQVNVIGGAERELKIVVDPAKMARYGLTVPDVIQRLRESNASISAGDVEEGKRRYVVRTDGELDTPEDAQRVLLRTLVDPDTGRVARVTVADIADVRFGYKEPEARIRFMGEPALAINAVRETGANVIETMEGVHAALDELNAQAIPREGLKFELVYQETTYIDSAIELVRQNIWVGGTLAALILYLFLRSGAATLIVSIAIPVSIVGSFVAMAALGRSINVISLAGLAFAVGMVVDAAIVVLENIYRLRQRGMPAPKAAYEGTRQVWGAVFVSALTTVLVFVPILIMDDEVGQLFRDIAVAISVAVLLSLIVSVTVIPALSNRLLARPKAVTTGGRQLPVIDAGARGFVTAALSFARGVVNRKGRAALFVIAVCLISGLATWMFLPKLEYLPEGNRNLVFGNIIPPPGYNLATTTEIAKDIEDDVRPLWATETGPDAEPGQPPKIQRYFFVARSDSMRLGAAAVDGSRVSELVPVLQDAVFKEPGTFGFVSQPSIFGRAASGSRSVDLEVIGPDLDVILEVARRAAVLIGDALPFSDGNQLRPRPGLELGAPEVRIYPDLTRLADNGLSARGFGASIDVFNDGLKVLEITEGGDRLDLTLTGPLDNVTETQGIANLPVVTGDGTIVPVSSLGDVVITSGPTEIRHLERERAVTLQIRPAPNLPLETVIDIVQRQVVAPLAAEGLPPMVKLQLSGTADKLTRTWDAMVWQLVLALAIVYLVMAVLFESFIFPLIICVSVPVAAAGGIAGLAVLNLFVYQPLDMLTLLGFVILVGIVVNNAILLVYQTLHHVRDDDMEVNEAILEAVRNRIRPIFMSTLTSIFGMLPLVLFPGAGSELYRGLGSVVVGGLSLSAVLTLAIVPPLLTLAAPLLHKRRRDPSPPTRLPAPKAAAE